MAFQHPIDRKAQRFGPVANSVHESGRGADGNDIEVQHSINDCRPQAIGIIDDVSDRPGFLEQKALNDGILIAVCHTCVPLLALVAWARFDMRCIQ